MEESVGQMIKRYREASDMTQEEVGLAVGLTFGAVSQWEKGRTHPRQAVAFRLDDFLQANGEIVAALGYARPNAPADELTRIWSKLAELEQAQTATASKLRALSDSHAELAQLSHTHAGRRRGEGIASGQ